MGLIGEALQEFVTEQQSIEREERQRERLEEVTVRSWRKRSGS